MTTKTEEVPFFEDPKECNHDLEDRATAAMPAHNGQRNTPPYIVVVCVACGIAEPVIQRKRTMEATT